MTLEIIAGDTRGDTGGDTRIGTCSSICDECGEVSLGWAAVPWGWRVQGLQLGHWEINSAFLLLSMRGGKRAGLGSEPQISDCARIT